MISQIRRRTAGKAVPKAILAVGFAVIIVVAAVVLRHTAWLPSGHTMDHAHVPPPTSQAPTLSEVAPAGTPTGGSVAAVQLTAQDATPATHLSLTASGYLPREQLIVTIEDAYGNTYDQVTLRAGSDGRLPATPLAGSQQLATGSYQVLVVGDFSHRTAHATFRMHDEPPLVALDNYSSTPGQTIGFTGSGFIAGEQVQVSLGTGKTPLTTVRATDTGAVSGRVTIPALAAGNYTLKLTGSDSQTPVAVGFNVQGFAPWVVLNRYAVTPGQGVGFVGQGFAPGEEVLVYVNALPGQGQPALRVTADPSGRIVTQDTWVPSGGEGNNVLTFVGQMSKATAKASFTVLAGEGPTPTPAGP